MCASYYSRVTVHFTVPAASFQPAPKVESAFISLEPFEKTALEGKSEELFFRMVRAVFQSRRKTLWNSLKLLGKSTDVVRAGIEKAGLSPEVRGETLDLPALILLSKALENG